MLTNQQEIEKLGVENKKLKLDFYRLQSFFIKNNPQVANSTNNNAGQFDDVY
jgi:hypothetical protein